MATNKLNFFSNLTNLNYFQESYYEDESINYFPLDLKIIKHIKPGFLFIIISAGIIGNLLNIRIFQRKNMIQISTFKFFLALSINKFLALLFGGFYIFLNDVYQFEIRNYSAGLCKLHTYIAYCVT